MRTNARQTIKALIAAGRMHDASDVIVGYCDRLGYVWCDRCASDEKIADSRTIPLRAGSNGDGDVCEGCGCKLASHIYYEALTVSA